MPDKDAIDPEGLETIFADDGTDLSLIRWALSLSPLERLQAFEIFMDDIVAMLDAAHSA